jgi:hypothetical protein
MCGFCICVEECDASVCDWVNRKQELVEAGKPCPPRDDPKGWDWARKGTHQWLKHYIESAEEKWASLPAEDANYCRALHVHPLMMMFGFRQDATRQDITELGKVRGTATGPVHVWSVNLKPKGIVGLAPYSGHACAIQHEGFDHFHVHGSMY